MREIITIQVGQCGNQIGHEFWKKISNEHKIDLDDNECNDKKSTFFYQSDSGRYIPRCVLIDLEPRVVNSLTESALFNHENIYLSNAGGGAGNNWAHGYSSGNKSKSTVLDIIQREAENSDSFESFLLFHSTAGGTGSGFGSLLLEELKDNFPKKNLSTYSIFPNQDEGSDVVVQPYNTVLTMERLIKHSNMSILMENGSLQRAMGESIMDRHSEKRMSSSFQESKIDESVKNNTPFLFSSFSHINTLIATVISESTSTLRFPTYLYSDHRSIINTLCPLPSLNFVIPSFTPFIVEDYFKISRKTSCLDVMSRLLMEKYRMIGTNGSIISSLNILSNVCPLEVQRGFIRVMERNSVNFVPWKIPGYHVVISGQNKKNICGLGLNNITGIASYFRKITNQYDKLRKKNAFIDIYRKFNEDLNIFDQARETVENAIQEYEKSELSSYINQ
ncbi:gamma chain of tubulin [Hamiltosporidium magnivora]|uniref:Tubulin gamma chain n=1 Tax=Hamiltosporidium magnivora TaxID=148818 RepID=A0A4Q9L1P1_9MICR|nr:gamma chain of tubulin [Hamiltosporidium magnivora]